MIVIIDYKAGNLTSVKRALDYLSIPNMISADADVIRKADRVIFPGVGHATSAVRVMKERGLDVALKNAFMAGAPILGICLGTQIILSHSEEGDTECLGLIEGNCLRFRLKDPALKIPHIGWNRIIKKQEHVLLRDIKSGDEVYFVHSFYPQPKETSMVYAVTDYEMEFPSAVGYKNLFATQFHPEKSGPVGLRILKNFSGWDGVPC